MRAFSCNIIVIGLLASLSLVSVAQAKCYPGLDCPDDLPNANNTPNQPTPEPSTTHEPTTPESSSTREPTLESAPPESVAVDKIVGHKIPNDSSATVEEAPALTKYGNYPKSVTKYSKYPK